MKIKLSYLFLIFSFSTAFADVKPDSFFNFTVNNIAGEKVKLSKYEGKVVLVVNTASHCGFTPQYEALQIIYSRYHEQGLEILAFPSNDFGAQEPGSAKEIKNFCETKYKVTFPLFEKNSVSGKNIQPLYDWLIHHEPESAKNVSEVKWNFEKFLISRKGTVLARYRSITTPDSTEVKTAIEAALKK